MKKKTKFIIIFLIVILCIIGFFVFSRNKTELKTVKSEKELLKLYDNYYSYNSEASEIFLRFLSLPFSFIDSVNYGGYGYVSDIGMDSYSLNSDFIDAEVRPATSSSSASNSDIITEAKNWYASSGSSSSSKKDYSTTNIQVENVDEADITKTDGDYIYSISDNYVVITNVKDPENIKIEKKLPLNDGSIPEDLILYNDKLVVISAKNPNSTYYYKYNINNNTIVRVYNIEDKSNPLLLKSFELYEPYYTSRCIDNNLYVIASGNLRKENNKIIRTYEEDGEELQIKLNNIKYIEDVKTRSQTLISLVDLNDLDKSVALNSYLMDISNAYVSENSIYLLQQKYDYSHSSPSIGNIFGLKGILGLFDWEDNSSNGLKTEIYKFNIQKDGSVDYTAKNKVEGRTINQYSLDEFNNYLRVALYNEKGARVVILDENLKEIGSSKYVAKGETMYSSRFMGNKAYLVTYRVTDPLFVIDLSDETKPKVLGELHIPGYSTYLHPYDENHIIGIGMETEETINKNSSGKVTFTSSRITGMKMALFDVSDVNNPVQMSQIVIGDNRTTSAILTNPKALLFSKAKQLIAIPVNNYSSDFEVTSSNNTYSSMVNSYVNYNSNRVSEGYFVCSINLEEGFKLKGIITHDTTDSYTRNSYYNSKLLRGLYIDDNLYTVSETAVKVNDLDTLELISELKIK